MIRVGDIVVNVNNDIHYLYECDFEMRNSDGSVCCGVFYTRIVNNRIERFGCDKNYFIENFKTYRKE